MDTSLDRNRHFYAGAGTLVSLLVLLIPIVLVTFKTPVPPFEEGGSMGIEVNLGFDEEGMGQDYSTDKPFADDKSQQDASQSSSDASPDNNDVMTSDDPDAVSVPPKKNTPDKKNDDPQPDKNLQDAISGSNFNDGNPSSDGTGNVKGNQGDPNGTPDSKNYDGDGKGTGYGPKVSLKGRTVEKKPDNINDFSQNATVVVEITVDADGKVINAKVNQTKSKFDEPANASTIIAKARLAALTTRFNKSPDGAPEQTGTITFVFKVK
ncbi:MAG: energy transducer TonB [Bacteroidota bacterium]